MEGTLLTDVTPIYKDKIERIQRRILSHLPSNNSIGAGGDSSSNVVKPKILSNLNNRLYPPNQLHQNARPSSNNHKEPTSLKSTKGIIAPPVLHLESYSKLLKTSNDSSSSSSISGSYKPTSSHLINHNLECKLQQQNKSITTQQQSTKPQNDTNRQPHSNSTRTQIPLSSSLPVTKKHDSPTKSPIHKIQLDDNNNSPNNNINDGSPKRIKLNESSLSNKKVLNAGINDEEPVIINECCFDDSISDIPSLPTKPKTKNNNSNKKNKNKPDKSKVAKTSPQNNSQKGNENEKVSLLSPFSSSLSLPAIKNSNAVVKPMGTASASVFSSDLFSTSKRQAANLVCISSFKPSTNRIKKPIESTELTNARNHATDGKNDSQTTVVDKGNSKQSIVDHNPVVSTIENKDDTIKVNNNPFDFDESDEDMDIDIDSSNEGSTEPRSNQLNPPQKTIPKENNISNDNNNPSLITPTNDIFENLESFENIYDDDETFGLAPVSKLNAPLATDSISGIEVENKQQNKQQKGSTEGVKASQEDSNLVKNNFEKEFFEFIQLDDDEFDDNGKSSDKGEQPHDNPFNNTNFAISIEPQAFISSVSKPISFLSSLEETKQVGETNQANLNNDKSLTKSSVTTNASIPSSTKSKTSATTKSSINICSKDSSPVNPITPRLNNQYETKQKSQNDDHNELESFGDIGEKDVGSNIDGLAEPDYGDEPSLDDLSVALSQAIDHAESTQQRVNEKLLNAITLTKKSDLHSSFEKEDGKNNDNNNFEPKNTAFLSQSHSSPSSSSSSLHFSSSLFDPTIPPNLILVPQSAMPAYRNPVNLDKKSMPLTHNNNNRSASSQKRPSSSASSGSGKSIHLSPLGPWTPEALHLFDWRPANLSFHKPSNVSQ